jgi:hypothetical protein
MENPPVDDRKMFKAREFTFRSLPLYCRYEVAGFFVP